MATVVIKINLVDLTDIIIFSDAHFDSRVNGEPGPCEFRVRDDNNDLVFEAGQSITVDINAERVWTGYLMQATSTYIFPVGPLPPDVPRIWRIIGVDINILFRRRIVVDPVDPTVMTGKTYKYTGTPTPDTTAIASLVTDFLDLSGDDLDVSTFVENVGDINVDQDTNAFGASWTWEQAMASIAALPAAIYYLDPDRNLVYTDVDTPNAPFGISDQPDGVATFGYREPELLKDASNLINDYLAWGIGTGSNEPVFKRLIDDDSVTAHGRWQQASLTYDVYKQATVDRIADSWINGSPTSRRGHKDDKIAFMCTVFEPGLQAGMKVDVTSNVFAFNDVLPVRELRLSFANQTDPIYRLTLSHAIDTPWSFYQMFNPKLPKLAWDDIFVLLMRTCGCSNDPSDTFSRTAAGASQNTSTITTHINSLGIADSYSMPVLNLTRKGSGEIDGSRLLIEVGQFATATQNGVSVVWGWAAVEWLNQVHSIEFELGYLGLATPAADRLDLQWLGLTGLVQPPHILIINDYPNLWVTNSFIGFSATETGATVIPTTFWQVGVTYTWRLYMASPTTLRTEVTNGTTTYSNDLGFVPTTYGSPFVSAFREILSPYTDATDWPIYFENLDLPEINACSIPITLDDFSNRTLGATLGISILGYPWSLAGTGTASVTSGYGRFLFTSGQTKFASLPAGGPWTEPLGWQHKFDFYIEGSVPSGANYAFVDWTDDDGVYEIFIQISSGSNGQIRLFSGGTATLAKTDWVADTWYSIRTQYTPNGRARFRVWETADEEPDDWDASTTALAAPTGGLVLDPGAVGVSANLRIDNIGFVICRPGGSGRFSGVSDGSDTIDLGDPFWKGTSRVWLDGEAKKLTDDYTEDYDEGLIIFNSTPATGLDVVVTRVSRTPLGGGASRRVI